MISKNFILDNLKTLFYALVIAIVIRSLLLQPFYIPSSSMEPNLLVGDRLFVTKYSYGYSKHSFPFSPNIFNGRLFFSIPKRGDVVVFKTPADNRTDYIKRLIGLPGDEIQFIEGDLYINNIQIFKTSIKSDEEVFCGNVHKILKNTEKDVLTFIIPRHINRTKKIYLNLKKMGFRVQIKNELDLIDETAEIVLINYYGSVLKYLRFIKQIFIGKSLLKKLKNVGGQNPIDAAKMGCQVYHGPYVYNFQEIYDYLNKEKIAEKINTPETLAEKLIENFNTHSVKKTNDIDHLKIYSEEIFKKVIDEYKKFIK